MANPSLTIAGKRIVFPLAIQSGQYIEFNSMSDCKLRDARGAVIREITPEGDVPTLASGENAVGFACDASEPDACRANVTVICRGDVLRGVAPDKENLKQMFRHLDQYHLTHRPDGTLSFIKHGEK